VATALFFVNGSSSIDNGYIVHLLSSPLKNTEEEFEDTKGVIRIHKSKKERQHNGQNPPVKSEPITTKVLSLNPAHGEVYSIQHYVIKFVSDLRQVSGFLRVLWFPPPIKLTAMI
jgi:hypothetical protein